MNIRKLFRLFLVSTSVILLSNCSAQFKYFITADSDKLKDGQEEFRFVSYNMPNLHYVEDYMNFEQNDPWRLPAEYEIRDALRAIKQCGGKVTRTYVLSVRKEGESETIIRHVIGPGKFNEEAFKVLDKVMQIANEEGIRVIIPLLDNWIWWGGPKEYAAFRGKNKNEFWTDTLLISDFKKTVDFIINRKNTYTGTLYKDEKALLGWETGNELQCPYSWCAEIAKYIKSLDKNHLVIQNTHVPLIADEEITDPNIDVVSTHYYTTGDEAVKFIKKNRLKVKGRKPFYVGEFGFQPTKDMAAVIDTVIQDSVSGIMLWCMRPHNKDGGFYYHSNDYNVTSYRWPGFESGKPADEKNVISMMREKSFRINNLPIQPVPVPDPPVLLQIETPYEIYWQGSTGASSYSIQRKTVDESTWITLIDSIDDAVWPYKPQFSDTTVTIGKSYLYRMKARSESGESGWSNVAGPVTVECKMLIDEMENDKKIFYKKGDFEFITSKQIAQAKEDRNRLSGTKGSYIIYKIPGSIKSANVNFFITEGENGIDLLASNNMNDFIPLNVKKDVFIPEKNEYKLFTCVRYYCKDIPSTCSYIKIIFGNNIQIGRIEFSYIENN